MADKNSGFEYDREAFVHPAEQAPRPYTAWAVGAIVATAILLLGYVIFGTMAHSAGEAPTADTRVLLEVQSQLSQMQDRLDKLEQNQKKLAAAQVTGAVKSESAPAAVPKEHSVAQVTYNAYTISPPSAEQERLGRGLSTVEGQTAANQKALQATTERLAAVVGQVGDQQGQILSGQKELDELLANAAHQTYSFELRRGPSLQPVGPLYLSLRASNAKRARYTLCVYLLQTCIELKDRSPFEVVQFTVSKDAAPYQVIATKVEKDQVVGFLEVPRKNTARYDSDSQAIGK
jgi:hypothetical protein